MKNIFTLIIIAFAIFSIYFFSGSTKNENSFNYETELKAELLNNCCTNYDSILLKVDNIIVKTIAENKSAFLISEKELKSIIVAYSIYNIIDTSFITKELILYNNIFYIKTNTRPNIFIYKNESFLVNGYNTGYSACDSYVDATQLFMTELKQYKEIREAKTIDKFIKELTYIRTVNTNILNQICLKTRLFYL